MERDTEKLKQLFALLPQQLRGSLAAVPPAQLATLTELRIRAGAPLELRSGGASRFLGEAVDETLFAETADRLCGYSLHAVSEPLARGAFTLGGFRIGAAGSCSYEEGAPQVGRLSSLCIRIAREHTGCAEPLRQLLGGSLLIAGMPGSGKTSLLRDLARIAASPPLCRSVAVVDERGELGGKSGALPGFALGPCADLLDGYRKPHGIRTAVRSLSPQLIVCDEVGGREELEALAEAERAGVRTACSAHIGGEEALLRSEGLLALVRGWQGGHVVFLGDAASPGNIREIAQSEALA